MVLRNKLFPEPGTWVIDNRDGLSPVQPPDHDITIPMTTKEVADEVEYHGLGFCIFDWIQPKYVQDKELRILWIKARNVMREIRDCLDKGSQRKRKKAMRLSKGKRLL
jgi:hypothetical protein